MCIREYTDGFVCFLLLLLLRSNALCMIYSNYCYTRSLRLSWSLNAFVFFDASMRDRCVCSRTPGRPDRRSLASGCAAVVCALESSRQTPGMVPCALSLSDESMRCVLSFHSLVCLLAFVYNNNRKQVANTSRFVARCVAAHTANVHTLSPVALNIILAFSVLT